MAIPYGSTPKPKFILPIIGTLVAGAVYGITLHMYGILSLPIKNKAAISQFENTNESYAFVQSANVDGAFILGIFWAIVLLFMWYPYIAAYVRYRRSKNA